MNKNEQWQQERDIVIVLTHYRKISNFISISEEHSQCFFLPQSPAEVPAVEPSKVIVNSLL